MPKSRSEYLNTHKQTPAETRNKRMNDNIAKQNDVNIKPNLFVAAILGVGALASIPLPPLAIALGAAAGIVLAHALYKKAVGKNNQIAPQVVRAPAPENNDDGRGNSVEATGQQQSVSQNPPVSRPSASRVDASNQQGQGLSS